MRDVANDKTTKPILINVSKITNEDGSPVDLKSASKLRRWLIQNYDKKEVKIIDNGKTVRFAKKELQASMKKRGEAHNQIYSDLDKLLENSVYYGYERGDAKHPWVDRQDIYYAAAKIDGNTFGVRLKIDIQKKDGSGVYKDHKVAGIEVVEEVDIKKSPSTYRGAKSGGMKGDKNPSTPYAGFSPAGTVDGQSVSVLKIHEALDQLDSQAPKICHRGTT